MAISFEQQKVDPLVPAFNALVAEHSSAGIQLKQLQTRMAALEHAIAAMRPLLPQEDMLMVEEDDEPTEESDGQDPFSPFMGLKFAQALHRFMLSGKTPQSTTDIARGFEAAGWKFKATESSAKVNQVGVTLRRFKGKLFDAGMDNRWTAISPF